MVPGWISINGSTNHPSLDQRRFFDFTTSPSKMTVKGGLAAADADVGGPAKLRRRHQHAPRSPLQSLDTNRPSADHVSQDLITPRNTPVRYSDCANANANDGVIVTKRPDNHGASFFSPPRAIREPIPFLSPTVPNYKDFVGTDDVRLLRNPALTMRYFLEGVAECALRNIRWPAVLTKKVTGAILTVLVSLWGLLHLTLAGRFDDHVRANNDARTLPSEYGAWLISATMEASFWVGCGILSTAGLGSGVQVSLSPSGGLHLVQGLCVVDDECTSTTKNSPTTFEYLLLIFNPIRLEPLFCSRTV